MAVKTFTTGEILTAADTNTYLNNGGLVYVASGSPAANATINIDSVFTSTYRNYQIVIRGTASTGTPVYIRYRAAGAALTDNIYSNTFGNSNGSTAVAGSARSDQYGLFPAMYATYPSNIVLNFFNPQVTDYTTYTIQGQYPISATDNGFGLWSGSNKVTTSVDGFQITTAAAPTLTISYTIYGMRIA
ncbi:MAG: hypothetical protein EB145_09990 [Proteobacteria bacterium]|nr:hypothetical protein [Pseudomonadota bacterium]